jgi:hypothetical protein
VNPKPNGGGVAARYNSAIRIGKAEAEAPGIMMAEKVLAIRVEITGATTVEVDIKVEEFLVEIRGEQVVVVVEMVEDVKERREQGEQASRSRTIFFVFFNYIYALVALKISRSKCLPYDLMGIQ